MTCPMFVCTDRVITDQYDRMRLADLAAAENAANAPRAGEDATPERIAFLTNCLWKPGRVIRVAFLGGTVSQREDAKRAAAEIEAHAFLKFDFNVAVADSDIRVSFDQSSGAWSMVGTDALGVGKGFATMNLGFSQPGTYVHEFLHAVGAIHEHQHPEAGIRWNEPAVYEYYAGPPNYWDADTTKHNVIDRYSKTQSQYSTFDPTSVMLYPIDARLTLNGFSSAWNQRMSATDKAWLAKTYPKPDVPPPGSPTYIEIGQSLRFEPDPARLKVGDTGKLIGTFRVVGRG